MTNDQSDPRRRPPPNYFARSVQLKILLLLALFMGVLAMMSHARKPETWQWMWKMQGATSPDTELAPGVDPHDAKAPAQVSRDTARAGQVDTRPPRQHSAEPDPGEPIVTGKVAIDSAAQRPSTSLSENLTTAQLDGWDHVLRQLTSSQRELLRQGLWRERHDQPLTGDERAQWSGLMTRLQEAWDDYHTRALVAVAQDDGQLTAAQKRLSVEIVEASKGLWRQRSIILAALGDSHHFSDDERAVLADLQRLLDRRALQQIEDNTTLRSAETDAWYRCWEQLEALTPAARQQAKGPLTFVQLFSQPSEFRGQLVKVTGTVRWAYRVTSQSSQQGIDHYYVLGILPGQGTSSPIVVYCLDLPPSFPQIPLASPAQRGRPLDEDVEITGYFFKRWLHSSAGGMSLSPLILGRITQWEPRQETAQEAATAWANPWTITWTVLAMAILATGIAIWVYRTSRWSRTEISLTPSSPNQLPIFDQTQVQASIVDTLRDLSQADGEQEENA